MLSGLDFATRRSAFPGKEAGVPAATSRRNGTAKRLENAKLPAAATTRGTLMPRTTASKTGWEWRGRTGTGALGKLLLLRGLNEMSAAGIPPHHHQHCPPQQPRFSLLQQPRLPAGRLDLPVEQVHRSGMRGRQLHRLGPDKLMELDGMVAADEHSALFPNIQGDKV